jgi:hypothetical protein
VEEDSPQIWQFVPFRSLVQARRCSFRVETLARTHCFCGICRQGSLDLVHKGFKLSIVHSLLATLNALFKNLLVLYAGLQKPGEGPNRTGKEKICLLPVCWLAELLSRVTGVGLQPASSTAQHSGATSFSGRPLQTRSKPSIAG